MTLARKGLLLAIVVLLILLVAAGAAFAAKPKHVMIVVMDQMVPGYAEKYDMSNVLWLQDHGFNYKHGWVGDMASETVVSHNVMVSGQFPSHMGWSDEAFRDVNNVVGLGANTIITSGDLGYADYTKLIEAMDYPKLGDYLHSKFPGTIVANVGEKGYQVESMAASSSDIAVRMGSKKATGDPSGLPWIGSYRGPSGVNVPAYIADDARFKVSVANDRPVGDPLYPSDYYGTKDQFPSRMYYEDGRYVAGPFDTNISGDTWVADAALKIMDNENWSGLWVTFSAIDKTGHMWGGGAVDTLINYNWTPNTLFEQAHLPWAAKHADDQLGRLIAELKAKGIFNDTLIVITADHGVTYGKHFYGTDEVDGASLHGWYAGEWHAGNTAAISTSTGPAALKPLMDTGKVEFSYQSTAIESWLKVDSSSRRDRLGVSRVMATLPGVIATYVREGDRYVLATAALCKMTAAERQWWLCTGQYLVDTMAWAGSADVVGLLADKTSYAAYGDHGGAQKTVQRIPMVFWAKGMKHREPIHNSRLVDITPTVLKAMGIARLAPMDGTARDLGL